MNKGYQGPGRYRHYKGNQYDVLGIGIHESELYRLVIYRPVTPVKVEGEPVEHWLRPLTDFNAEVEAGGQRVPRFEKISGVDRRG
jgi:hypothetical protein